MLYPQNGLNERQLQAREWALKDLETFIRLIAPFQLLAHCHIDLFKWVRKNEHENKLVLWPRDHGKSRTCAFYAAWNIIRNPAITIIYASATAEKAEEQLRFIKDLLTSPVTERYFPGLLNEKEGTRTAWNVTSIIVDHPYRKQQGVIDSTIMTCGLEKNITGKHCDILILDDIVVAANNNIVGRKQVNTWAAQAASIMSADAHILCVGTRYHPRDAYGMMIDMHYDEKEDIDGVVVDTPTSLFIVNQANVESDDQFLWPRMQRIDGKWFGFNEQILARKRAVYEASGEITQFFAQYYNDPNDKSTAPISRDLFLYYDRSKLEYYDGMWHVDGEPLHIYCAVDMATSVADIADYTVCIVGGIDKFANRYVLDIRRYRSDKISKTLETLKELYLKYYYKKLRIEAVSGFRLVAQDLSDSLKDAGVRVPVDLYIPPNFDGKMARVNGILEPLYQAGAIYHFRGGECQVLEDELCSINPSNDDTKDAWSMCVDLMERIVTRRLNSRSNVIQYHPRFGGVRVA